MIDRGKRSKKLSAINLFENISKDPQSFIDISLVQKVVLLHETHPSLSHIEQECQESLI